MTADIYENSQRGVVTEHPDRSDAEELYQEIEQTRAELGATVEALAHKLDVKTRAQEKIAERTQVLRTKGQQLRGRTVELGQTVRSAMPEGAQQAARQAAVKAKKRPLPIAIGAGMLVVIFCRLIRKR
jgi:uncharacterized protein (DUF3084 family)